jgi:hypothetical protein
MAEITKEPVGRDLMDNYDASEFVNTELDKIDRNFDKLFTAVNGLLTADNSDAGARIFIRNGVSYRLTIRDEYFELDKALTELGFDGDESVDMGVTGDWIYIYRWNFEPEV